jgi:hypothetical protein
MGRYGELPHPLDSAEYVVHFLIRHNGQNRASLQKVACNEIRWLRSDSDIIGTRLTYITLMLFV